MTNIDVLIPFVNGTKLNIDNVPYDILKQAFLNLNHRIEEEYVYGIKLVSKKYQDMFGANTYEIGKIYHYVDAESPYSMFCEYIDCIHGAGLWSHGCIEKLAFVCPKKPVILCLPILVRYPIKEAMPIGNTIKGRVMEVVSIDHSSLEKYVYHYKIFCR